MCGSAHQFLMLEDGSAVNVDWIACVTLRHLILSDGSMFPITFAEYQRLVEMLQSIRLNLNTKQRPLKPHQGETP